MRTIGLYLIVACLTLLSTTRAQSVAQRDSIIKEGIRQIYSVDFPKAENTFRKLISDYPDQPSGRFFLAMIDWWRILLDLDNESYDEIFFQKLEDVIFQCDKILDKDPDNIDALFFKGGAIGFRGRLHGIRESWLKSADDGREALPIVNRAAKLDPSNKDVELGFGIYNYYAAVIPQDYPMIKPLMVFFPPGNKEQGISQLDAAAREGRYSNFEARYFLMTLYSQFEKNPWKAEEYSGWLNSDFPNNPIFERWRGRIAVQRGDTEMYFKIFTSVFKKCDGNLVGYNDKSRREAAYYLGIYYKGQKNVDSALTLLTTCAQLSEKLDTKTETGFLVNSILYCANLYDVQGKRDKALELYNKLLEMRDYSDSRESAKRYIAKPFSFN